MWWLRRACASKGAPILGGVLVGLYVATRPRHGGAVDEPRYSTLEAPWKELGDELAARVPQRLRAEDTGLPRAAAEPSPTQVTAATPAPVTTTELESENVDCLQQHSARAGFDLQQSKETSPSACQKRCQCLEHCAFFTYWEDGNCHAQTKEATEMRNNAAVSGPAFCGKAKRLLPDRAPDLPKMQAKGDGHVGPKVYVYELPERFRNGGKDGPCFTADCVFGGPPVEVQGVEIWSSNQFHMPRMLYYRFLNSPRRTKDLNEADVFLVPAYSAKPSTETQCAKGEDLFQTLFDMNPALQDPAWGGVKASRHLFADARGWETCNYMWQLAMPFRMFHRVNIELNGLLDDGPEGWTDGKPFIWYQFPYPAVYHGPAAATPAKLRKRGYARYLWSFTGTGRGIAGGLRGEIVKQCDACSRCGRETQLPEVNGEAEQSEGDAYARIADVKLQSTFCLEPPGDTVTRKGLVDSIVLGCIPVVFEHQELDMFEPFLTAEQFRAIALFVPEAEVMGAEQPLSMFGTGTFGFKTKRGVSKKMQQLKSLYPEYAELLEALHPRFSQQERADSLKRLFPTPTPIMSILLRITEDEVRRKQDALAEVAHRLVIGLDDSSEDAVRILLDKIVANDEEAKRVEAKSIL